MFGDRCNRPPNRTPEFRPLVEREIVNTRPDRTDRRGCGRAIRVVIIDTAGIADDVHRFESSPDRRSRPVSVGPGVSELNGCVGAPSADNGGKLAERVTATTGHGSNSTSFVLDYRPVPGSLVGC